MQLNKSLFFISFIILMVCSCTKESLIDTPETGKITLLAYLAADNSLHGEAEQKVQALLKGWNRDHGRLLIFKDAYDGAPLLLKAVKHNGRTNTDTLKRYSNHNSASAVLLKEVITDMRTLSPCSYYDMILFSHGTGWLPEGADLYTYINPNSRNLIPLTNKPPGGKG